MFFAQINIFILQSIHLMQNKDIQISSYTNNKSPVSWYVIRVELTVRNGNITARKKQRKHRKQQKWCLFPLFFSKFSICFQTMSAEIKCICTVKQVRKACQSLTFLTVSKSLTNEFLVDICYNGGSQQLTPFSPTIVIVWGTS